jgi:hypothetical protein
MSTPIKPRTTRAEELKTAAIKKKMEEAEGTTVILALIVHLHLCILLPASMPIVIV